MKNEKPDRKALEALISHDPSAAYVFARDILGAKGKELETIRAASLRAPLMLELIADLERWPGIPLASHKSAEQCFHKLSLATELGLAKSDPGAGDLASKVMASVSDEGPFALPMKIGAGHGGSGESLPAWALCDAPVTLRAIVRMGYGKDARVVKAIDHLASLAFARGWPCAASATLGGWRGPGRKDDPCPYATLVMLELLLDATDDDGRRMSRFEPLVASAATSLLDLWKRSRDAHPYIFYMGNNFRKLKAPLLWYDLLHVLDALSRIEAIRKDKSLAQMVDVLEGQDEKGLFVPGSVYARWKGYDFGQKKAPSAYLSVVAWRILQRLGRL